MTSLTLDLEDEATEDNATWNATNNVREYAGTNVGPDNFVYLCVGFSSSTRGRKRCATTVTQCEAFKAKAIIRCLGRCLRGEEVVKRSLRCLSRHILCNSSRQAHMAGVSELWYADMQICCTGLGQRRSLKLDDIQDGPGADRSNETPACGAGDKPYTVKNEACRQVQLEGMYEEYEQLRRKAEGAI